MICVISFSLITLSHILPLVLFVHLCVFRCVFQAGEGVVRKMRLTDDHDHDHSSDGEEETQRGKSSRVWRRTSDGSDADLICGF